MRLYRAAGFVVGIVAALTTILSWYILYLAP